MFRIDAAHHRLQLGQGVRTDEAEPLEEIVSGRKSLQQIDHDLGRFITDAGEVVGQIKPVENRTHVRIFGDVLRIERRPDRRAEQDVFGERHIRVVAIGIEALD